MSTTDTILASLAEQVRQLQSAIDWLDDHRAVIDQCEQASVHPHGGPSVYLHAGLMPKKVARALGTKWHRSECASQISWHMDEPKLHISLALWQAEELTEPKLDDVEL